MEFTLTFHSPRARTVALAGEYKFLVNGREWWNDQNSPKVPNVWGSENSYLEVEHR